MSAVEMPGDVPAQLLPLSAAAVATFCKCIQISHTPEPTLENLRNVVRLFRQNIPFENLNPFFGKPVCLTEDFIMSKLVSHRGGFCFELNGILASALLAFGYRVNLVSARMWRPAGPAFGMNRTHMALIVHSPSEHDEACLVDIANGSWMVETLVLGSKDVQHEGHDGELYQLLSMGPGDVLADGSDGSSTGNGTYVRLYEWLPHTVQGVPWANAIPATELSQEHRDALTAGAQQALACHGPASLPEDGVPVRYQPKLVFELDLTPRAWAEFQPMCTFHSSDPLSPFTQGLVVTSLLPGGRAARHALVAGSWAGSACGGVASTWNKAEPTAIYWHKPAAHAEKEETVLKGWEAISGKLQEGWGITLDDMSRVKAE